MGGIAATAISALPMILAGMSSTSTPSDNSVEEAQVDDTEKNL